MENIEFHPLADIFPLIHGREFVDLKADIAANGLRESIVMIGDKILDGRNRFRACQETGTEAHFTDYDGDDALGYVLSLNLHRRHMNESQRAMVAANIANMEVGGDTVSDHSANLRNGQTSQAEAAEMVNVSERSVNTAKKVQAKALPEVQERVMDGDMAVSAAAEIASKPEETQAKILEKLDSGDAKNVKQATRQIEQDDRVASAPEHTEESVDIAIVDCIEGIYNLSTAPHLVVTDPPYGIDVHNTRRGGSDYADGADYALELLDDVAEALAKMCDRTAHLYFFAGYTHLHSFQQILSKHFDVQENPIIWVKDNHTMCDFSKAYPNKHEYIIYCRQIGSERKLAKCVPDVVTFKRERHSTHSAEKPTGLLKLLIEQSSVQGETVLDPFLGSGSTGVAAKDLGRKFVGFEIEEQWYDVARSRLA